MPAQRPKTLGRHVRKETSWNFDVMGTAVFVAVGAAVCVGRGVSVAVGVEVSVGVGVAVGGI
jgi:hypothetical protein